MRLFEVLDGASSAEKLLTVYERNVISMYVLYFKESRCYVLSLWQVLMINKGFSENAFFIKALEIELSTNLLCKF